jgi:hypothetical protein
MSGCAQRRELDVRFFSLEGAKTKRAQKTRSDSPPQREPRITETLQLLHVIYRGRHQV